MALLSLVTLLPHGQLSVHQDAQIFPQSCSPAPACPASQLIPPQAQGFAFVSPFLQPAKVPLKDSTTIWHTTSPPSFVWTVKCLSPLIP